MEDNVENNPETQNLTPRIPPIMIKCSGKFAEICAKIQKTSESEIKFRLQAGSDYFKVIPDSENHHRQITTLCKDEEIEYFLISKSNTRPAKVVMKGLTRETECQTIANELIEMDFNVDKVVQLKKLKNRQPLPIFQITLKDKTKLHEIQKITRFMYMSVVVETYNRPGIINQCYRCQGFNHSSVNCHIAFKCVKCGEQHDSRTCKKSRDTPATCANCGGDHPANHTKCPIYIEQTNIMKKRLKIPILPPESTRSV